MFDVLIIGGGASGMSCALVLGSAKDHVCARAKKIGLIAHQKTSHLQNALFNNVLGLTPGTTGASILESGKKQLHSLYPHVQQIDTEKVTEILRTEHGFLVKTNKTEYSAKLVVVAVGYTNLFTIKGLDSYVAGTLAGWRSQFAIACGSGAQVATDILTLWNNGEHVKIHDKVVV